MTRNTLYTLLATLAIAVCLCSPLAAQECAPNESGCLVDVSYAGATVQFSPLEDFRALTLTISGPGGDLVKAFAQGDRIEVDVREVGSGGDGRYSWTLRREAQISDELRAELAAARRSDEGNSTKSSFAKKGELPPGPFTASGWFEVQEGAVLDPRGLEESTPAAGGNEIARKVVLTNGDGVIRNSLCVGFDCPDNPSFSDTTILMMENNTRIKFDDTSNTASFPNNDWEIEANSSLNGGANYLAFNDCGNSSQGGCAEDLVFGVEAGARSRALWVDSGGDVGVGTGTPVLDLHIVTGNTPSIRLEQDNSSGFTPQTWDISGNETNFFIRDATNGSQLPIRIQPGADSNSLFIENTNDVGIGTSAPTDALHVRGTDGSTRLLVEEANGTTNGRQVMELRNNGNVNFILVNTAVGGEDWQLLAESTGGFPGFSISRQGSGVRELYLDDSGNLEITGEITTSGSCSIGCDLVFDPDYELPTIEEHAAEMFAKRHLPAVGPTPEEGSFNLSQKVGGMLNELEKAHIYIARLNDEKNAEIEALRSQIEALETRLNELAEK